MTWEIIAWVPAVVIALGVLRIVIDLLFVEDPGERASLIMSLVIMLVLAAVMGFAMRGFPWGE